MPVMDGYESSRLITQTCKTNNIEVPFILALSAHVNKEVVERCKREGISGVELKPISVKKLEDILRSQKLI